MSSDDDSYSFNESQTFGRIVELLKLRTEPNRRRLYDNEPVARRSLKVQKIFKKPGAEVVENLVFKEPLNDVPMHDANEVMQTSVPTCSPIRTQKKSIFCSTPMAVNTKKKFLSSLSPVKNVSVRPTSKLVEFAVLSQKSQNKISNVTAPKPQAEYNLKLMQPRVVLSDVLNSTKGSKIVPPERPSNIINKRKPKLNLSPSKSVDTTSRSIPNTRIITNSNSHDRETLKPPEPSFNGRYLVNSEPNRGRSGFPTEEFLPELSLKLPSAGRHMPQSSDLDPKFTTFNARHQNVELPNLNSKRASSLIGSSQQKAAEISNLKNLILGERSASSEIDNRLVIPENNDEMENGTSTSPTKKRSNHNDILNVEVTQKTSQPHTHDPLLVGASTSSSLVAQSISKTQQVSRSKNPVLTRVRKKKNNDTYSNFLALEKSAKRKSSKSGSKRKLYSSEDQFTNLTVTQNSEPVSTQGKRNFKVTPTLTQSTLVRDAEGFKVPNKSSRKENADDPIVSAESEIEVIEENIRILNKSQLTDKICEITKDVIMSKSSGKKKCRKLNTPKITQNNVEGDATNYRCSTRIKHAPVTFWKVSYKEPIVDYQTKFYTKMFLNKADCPPKKAKQKLNKAQPIAEIVEPILEESQKSRLNVINEKSETVPIEKNTNLQGTRNEETAFTLPKRNTKERSKFDSALQETSESADDQTNPHINFLKKFYADCLSDENVQRAQQISSRLSDNDLIEIFNFPFKKFPHMTGIEFSFVPNTNEMVGFLKLQCGSKKSVSRTSRKYFLTLMLFTKTSVTVKINEKATEMILGKLDVVQLPPDSKYELINNSTKPAILMTVRSLAK